MIYFDNAATTFIKPPEVYMEMNKFMQLKGGNPGRGGHFMSMSAANDVFLCRQEIASMINKSPEEIVLCPSATYALNLAIKGILSHKDHAVLTSDSHNSAVRPLNSTAQFSVCHNPDDAERKIKKNTKMLIVNHASNVSGEVCDLEGYKKLSKAYRLLLLLDASQSMGHINFSADGIDMIACAGHKALLGPQGTGFLYVRKGIKLKPLIEGGTGFHSESVTQPREIPEGLESGTINGVGFAGLKAGIKYVKNIDFDKQDKVFESLKTGLSSIPKVILYLPTEIKTVPVISFNIKDEDPVSVAEYLSEKHRVCVRSGLHCAPLAHRKLGTLTTGTVRASLSCYSKQTEVEKFLNIIDSTSNFVV